VAKGLLTIIEKFIDHTQNKQQKITISKDEVRVFKGEKMTEV